MHEVYLSLGTNLGEKEKNLKNAIIKIQTLIGTVTRQSAFITTAPWGFQSDNQFLNCCILCLTSLTPREVLCRTQQIELELGRNSKSKDKKYHDRVIDIDILLYDSLSINEPDLKIPHPLMYQRDFVMIPLREIKKENV